MTNLVTIFTDSLFYLFVGTRETPSENTWPNFKELLNTKMCLAWHFFLDKRQYYQPNFHLIFRISEQQLNTNNKQYMQQIKMLLVILFLHRKTFHAKQICVLSSSMKLGPGLRQWPKVSIRSLMRILLIRYQRCINTS